MQLVGGKLLWYQTQDCDSLSFSYKSHWHLTVKDPTYSWESMSLPNIVAKGLMSQVFILTAFLLKNNFAIGYQVTPTVRDSIKFSLSGKDPQSHKFCLNKKILILKTVGLPW